MTFTATPFATRALSTLTSFWNGVNGNIRCRAEVFARVVLVKLLKLFLRQLVVVFIRQPRRIQHIISHTSVSSSLRCQNSTIGNCSASPAIQNLCAKKFFYKLSSSPLAKVTSLLLVNIFIIYYGFFFFSLFLLYHRKPPNGNVSYPYQTGVLHSTPLMKSQHVVVECRVHQTSQI